MENVTKALTAEVFRNGTLYSEFGTSIYALIAYVSMAEGDPTWEQVLHLRTVNDRMEEIIELMSFFTVIEDK